MPHSEHEGASSMVARWRVEASRSAYFAVDVGALAAAGATDAAAALAGVSDSAVASMSR